MGRREANVMVAERVGFEPTVPVLAAHTISSRVPSASSDISPQFCCRAVQQKTLLPVTSLPLSESVHPAESRLHLPAQATA
jgi:hypothetical protein